MLCLSAEIKAFYIQNSNLKHMFWIWIPSGTLCANKRAASLMILVKTPPPTLLRAQFATVLDHLPSVPSVVLPNMSSVSNDWALLLLNLIFQQNTAVRSFWINFAESLRPKRFKVTDSRSFLFRLTKSVSSLWQKFVFCVHFDRSIWPISSLEKFIVHLPPDFLLN